MSTAIVRPMVVLMVEDNPGDVVFFQEATEASRTPADFHIVTNGAEALQYLRQEAPFGCTLRPDVMVLDLNLPFKNGQEVMAEIGSDPAVNTIPVAILTTSTSESSICDLYPEGRCLYFTKTDDFRQLQDIVRKIAAHAERSPHMQA